MLHEQQQSPSPKTRLEIYGCETQGSKDMVLTFYNDQEVTRRSIQVTAWMVLSTVIENDDVATLIVAYMRELVNKEAVSPLSFEPLVFDETVQQVVDITNKKFRMSYIRYNGNKMIAHLEQLKRFFIGLVKNETTQKVTINMDDWYPMDAAKAYGEIYHESELGRQQEVIQSMMAILLCSLFLHVSSVNLTVHSHNRSSLFDECSHILTNLKACNLTKSVLGSSFWMGVKPLGLTESMLGHNAWIDEASCLQIEKCIYCVRQAMEKEREKNNLLLLEATLEAQHSSWCTSQ